MKTCALAAAAAALAFCAPAHAMEHKTVIDHAGSPIVADYVGAARVVMQQVGSAGAAGRPGSLRCNWTVSLTVERQARLASGQAASRSLARSAVVKGWVSGWCPDRGNGAERIVARHRDKVRAAMMALVEQDRARLLAEADSLHPARIGG